MKNPDISQAHTKAFYDEHGFALVRNAFSPEEIAQIRGELENLFAVPSPYEGDWDNKELIRAVRCDLFNRYPPFRRVLFNPAVLRTLKDILGDVAVVPESVAHYKGYGPWHKDTTSQERDGQTFHYDPAYNMVECAVYLQDNDAVFGGGLDVVPGTHRDVSDGFLIDLSGTVFRRLLNKWKYRRKQRQCTRDHFSVPQKAGDFVLFNKRLDHRASLNTRPAQESPVEKLAVFFIAGTNNAAVTSYTDYMVSRYSFMKDYRLDEEFANACRENGITPVVPSQNSQSLK